MGRDEWFADGIHMNWDGGTGFARFLRALVLDACTAACAQGDGVLVVRTDSLRKARVGARYVGRLVASGGTPPYRWSVVGLPQPLHLRSDGAIWGRPRASGTFELVAAVVDAAGVGTGASSSSMSAARAGDATQPLAGVVADRLHVVAVRIEHEGAVVALVVGGPQARGAVVDAARRDCRLVEGIDGLGVRRGEGDVCGGARDAPLADPQVRHAAFAEPESLDVGELHHDLDPERRERLQVERARPLVVGDVEGDVVEHARHRTTNFRPAFRPAHRRGRCTTGV